jgi:hypothetical protein
MLVHARALRAEAGRGRGRERGRGRGRSATLRARLQGVWCAGVPW